MSCYHLVIYKFFDFTFSDGPTERVEIDDKLFRNTSRWAEREEVVAVLLNYAKREWPNRELLRIDRPRTCERLYTRGQSMGGP